MPSRKFSINPSPPWVRRCLLPAASISVLRLLYTSYTHIVLFLTWRLQFHEEKVYIFQLTTLAPRIVPCVVQALYAWNEWEMNEWTPIFHTTASSDQKAVWSTHILSCVSWHHSKRSQKNLQKALWAESKEVVLHKLRQLPSEVAQSKYFSSASSLT